MTNKEAIKFLQQLYPNGGHCWLDEQRIEAIGMAVKALQEEHVSDDLEKTIDTYLATYFGSEKEKQEWPFLKKMAIYFAKWQKTKDESTTEELGEYINELSKQFPEVSFAKLSRIAVRVAKLQKKQMIKDAYEREVKVDAGGYPYIPQMELYDYDKDVPLAKKGDRVKVVVVKED